MKIYTKTGDNGTTSLIGGTRVRKNHLKIEAYGMVDELISYIGLVRDQKIDNQHKEFLISVQDHLMICASILATDSENCSVKIPKLLEKDVEYIELEMDLIQKSLPPLKTFILPGGHPIVSICHITRAVCRRTERVIVELSASYIVDDLILKYLNRLSDYLFILARKLSYDLNAKEIEWKYK